MDYINIEGYLFGFFVFLILLGNLAIHRMDENVTDSFKLNPIKPTLWQAFLWKVAMPKKLLTARNVMNLNRSYIFSLFIVFPSVALASDPTPLFVIFIAWPMIAIAIVLFFLVFFKLKNSLTCNLAFLIWHALVIAWASDGGTGGYMAREGEWVWFSLAINIASILFWFYQNSKKGKNHRSS